MTYDWHAPLTALKAFLPAGVDVEPRIDDEMQSLVVKETDEWIVSVTPMIFNDRILLTHRDGYPFSYTAGWCYDKGGAAVLAALVWDPDTERSPVGYKKVACDRREWDDDRMQATDTELRELAVSLFGAYPTSPRSDIHAVLHMIVEQAAALKKLYDDMPLQRAYGAGGWSIVPYGSVSNSTMNTLIAAALALNDANVAATEEGKKARCVQLAWCHAEAEWLMDHVDE